MTPRPLALALTLASFSTACGSEELECPATGAPLLSGVPELQPEWGPGCIDSNSWTADIAPANATWTVELRRAANASSMEIRPQPDGVAAMWGTELILVDGEGNELGSRDLNVASSWNSFVVTDDGRMIVGGQSGGVPQYRVFNPEGVEVWLRLLDVDNALFGQPSLVLADDGTLWVANAQFTPNFEKVQLNVQQWGVTGGKLSEVILPDLSAQQFARDGAGRFAVIDAGIRLFAADGTPLATVDLGESFTAQILGLDEGFVLGGQVGDLPVITRLDGQGEIVWQRTLESSYGEDYYYSYVLGLALLPDGGVVAVGSEATIDVQWPDSSLHESQQPFVIALDDAGVPTWGERLAVGGTSWSVAVGSAGEVYVGGTAQGSLPSEYGSVDQIGWLRRYDP